MKPIAMMAALFAVLILGACGVDGEPEQPERAATGISISGSVSVGLVGSN